MLPPINNQTKQLSNTNLFGFSVFAGIVGFAGSVAIVEGLDTVPSIDARPIVGQLTLVALIVGFPFYLLIRNRNKVATLPRALISAIGFACGMNIFFGIIANRRHGMLAAVLLCLSFTALYCILAAILWGILKAIKGPISIKNNTN